MNTFSAHYGFEKPDQNETADVAAFNRAMDLLDTEIYNRVVSVDPIVPAMRKYVFTGSSYETSNAATPVYLTTLYDLSYTWKTQWLASPDSQFNGGHFREDGGTIRFYFEGIYRYTYAVVMASRPSATSGWYSTGVYNTTTHVPIPRTLQYDTMGNTSYGDFTVVKNSSLIVVKATGGDVQPYTSNPSHKYALGDRSNTSISPYLTTDLVKAAPFTTSFSVEYVRPL